ncbi:MAG: hypothetical protein ACFFC7_06150 [Candidatus Hermodarchaeota archaeon]
MTRSGSVPNIKLLHSDFLAGGGTEEEWIEMMLLMKKFQELMLNQLKEEILIAAVHQAVSYPQLTLNIGEIDKIF